MSNITIRKLVWWMTNIDFWLVVFLLVGIALLWTKWHRRGKCLLAFCGLVLVVVCVSPVPNLIGTFLENRFARPTSIPADVDGFVIIGFGIDRRVSYSRNVVSFNCACQRELTLVHLYKSYPTKKFLYTAGGVKRSGLGSLSGMTQKLLKTYLGKVPDNIMFEGRAVDTRNNAKYAYKLAKPQPNEKWVLVTSAINMPRAVGAFRKVGWKNIIPYPVDYRTTQGYDITFGLSLYHGFHTWTTVMYELVGLIYYYLVGYIDELLPSPKPLNDKL